MVAVHYIFCITLVLHVVIVASHVTKSYMSTIKPDALVAPAVIAFGDSIFDPGNNNKIKTITKANFPPYGKDFEGGVATGRFSNGKIPTDLLVQALGVKPLLPAYSDPHLLPDELPTGVSFASGGSGYDPLTAVIEGGIPLTKQMVMFKEYIFKLKEQVGDSEADSILRNARYLIFAGSNDFAYNYFAVGARQHQYNIPDYSDFLINQASIFISELSALGPQKLLIFGVPPLGCLPFLIIQLGENDRDCIEKVNMASRLFNKNLKASLTLLNTKLPLVNLTYIDNYKPLEDIILHPYKYGFEAANKGCCGTGRLEAGVFCNPLVPVTCSNISASVFWDAFHPTERAYKIIADYVISTYQDSLF